MLKSKMNRRRDNSNNNDDENNFLNTGWKLKRTNTNKIK
jgi:hypothetical protein